MSRPGVRSPVYPGTAAVQQPFKPVTVISVNPDARKAIVRDQFGSMQEIRCDIMRAKGNLPAPGEQWIIDRQYGDWIFGAILTGGTNGVEIPPENVTGLAPILTDYSTRIDNVGDELDTQTTALNASISSTNNNLATTNGNLTNLEQRSIGQTAAKGDLIAATAAGTVTRRAVGTDGQVLVADSAQPTGLAYRSPLALTAAVPGATAAGRYVGNTTAGAPSSGTYQTGDWVTSQSGFQWVCTAGGSPGTWRCPANEAIVSGNTNSTNLTALTNRVTAVEGEIDADQAPGKHIWYWTGGSVGPNSDVICTGYTQHHNVGIAALGSGTGLFTCRRAGRWSIGAWSESDAGEQGVMDMWLAFGNPNPIGPANAYLLDRKWRGAGFGGAGFLAQSVSWTGWVYEPDKNIAFNLRFRWRTAGTSSASVNYRVWMEYLGPFAS